MSAALGVYCHGSGCSAYSPDDGDNGHIGEWAYDDGLPGGEAGFDDEDEMDSTGGGPQHGQRALTVPREVPAAPAGRSDDPAHAAPGVVLSGGRV